MTLFLDKDGLERYHNNAVNTFAAKSDVIDLSQKIEDLKEETENNIEVVASVTACAVNEIKKTIGANDNLKVSFKDTNNLSNCSSIMNAFNIIDLSINSIKDIHSIIDSINIASNDDIDLLFS